MARLKSDDGQYSEQETARRRDVVLKHMLNTPPKPHSEMKFGKRKTKTRKTLEKQPKR